MSLCNDCWLHWRAGCEGGMVTTHEHVKSTNVDARTFSGNQLVRVGYFWLALGHILGCNKSDHTRL